MSAWPHCHEVDTAVPASDNLHSALPQVPADISNMRRLRTLDLSFNETHNDGNDGGISFLLEVAPADAELLASLERLELLGLRRKRPAEMDGVEEGTSGVATR